MASVAVILNMFLEVHNMPPIGVDSVNQFVGVIQALEVLGLHEELVEHAKTLCEHLVQPVVTPSEDQIRSKTACVKHVAFARKGLALVVHAGVGAILVDGTPKVRLLPWGGDGMASRREYLQSDVDCWLSPVR